MKLFWGDNFTLLRELPDNSVDSVVTDPPYGLKFMGKKWDCDVPSVELWSEVLRVLKPGGHLLSFGGTRTYHRMVCAIEDAGFEIRDQLQWIFGSGFPKSLDISKAIDRAAGVEREIVGENLYNARRTNGASKHRATDVARTIGPTMNTAPATAAAKQWQGFGTALKPANEPIVLARKPLSEKTVAANVLKWGVGGINVDGCRIPAGSDHATNCNRTDVSGWWASSKGAFVEANPQGRFPSNLLLDETAAEILDEQSGISSEKPRMTTSQPNNSIGTFKTKTKTTFVHGGTGGASRFFYVAKTSKRERNAGLEGMPKIESGIGDERPSGQSMQRLDGREPRKIENYHPTVKPIKLMSYLCRLVTPPNGTVLDPFMGSGSTGIAAKNEGFDFIGMELDASYFEIAQKRINESK